MNRRVRRKVAQFVEKEQPLAANHKEICTEVPHLDRKEEVDVDWTGLPHDTVVCLFSCLSYRDRASLASTCRTWRLLGASPCLWRLLDLRAHRCSSGAAMSLAHRCVNLQNLRFRGSEMANSIIHLQARNLREISGDCCNHITDATLSVIAARHEALESLCIGSDFCDRLTSEAVKAVAVCCPKLRKLRLFGLHDVDSETINSLAKHCKSLTEIAFVDFLHVDWAALGNVVSLKFLSVAGTKNIKWSSVANTWTKLGNLVGLDVSRTDISLSAATKLLSLESLKVFSALSCPVIEEENNWINYSYRGRLLLTIFHDILKGVTSLFGCTMAKGQNIFADWRNLKNLTMNLFCIMDWLEWVLPHSLIRIAEIHPPGLDDFWIKHGAALLLSLMQSPLDDVRERAATGIASFVVIDDESATVDGNRAEAVLRDGGIKLLLKLAKSCSEGVQSEAAKAIANLSVNAKVAKAVADEGGISTLADLARSKNRSVAEEAAGGLWNLSVGEEHKGAIAQAGGVKALVELISKWRSDGDIVLERAAGALANLAADEKCSMEVAFAGGVEALVMLARSCKYEGVQEQSARALANLAAHGDSNSNNSTVGSEEGALLALVQLTYSRHDGVRQEAAGALWNLSFDDRNREAIAAAGGVEALVALAQSCSNSSQGLQERAAGALWGLSVSESNSVAIGREGGIQPLVALARSEFEDVHETAAGALWNLAFNPGNAVCIVEEGGVPVLVHLCSSSGSKMARFMAALALAYMFDGRMEDVALLSSSSVESLKSLNLDGPRKLALKHIEDFVLSFTDPRIFSLAASSSASTPLTQVAESARIPEAGHLRCSGAEIGRFLGMVRNPSSVLRACAAFALLQFTLQGGRHAMHHICLLQNLGAARVLRAAAAASTAPVEAKIFAKLVLRNLELHQQEHGLQL